MTVQSVDLSWSSLGASTESRDGRNFTVSLTAAWQVVHTATTTLEEVLLANGVPRIGDVYAGTTIPCVRVNTPSRISPIYSIVTADFEASTVPGQQNPLTANPLNNPAEIQWSDTQTNEPIDQDIDGNPIVTANNEPIEGVTMDLPDPVLVVTKNFPVYNPHLLYQYRRAVNSDTFYSFPPGTCRLIAQQATRQDVRPVPYWKVTARFQFRYPINTTADKAWYARVLHEGYIVRLPQISGPDEFRHELDDSDPPQRVVKPVLLKADGRREKDPDAATWLEFKRYNALPFNALGFS
jgi:hypothetical protein